ncbi:MAG: chorismate synthase [Endomicrobium sp.]|nr:chorismate synthase [Endomicrobium sp.]
MIMFTTSGESHGKALIGIVEGIPAGLKIDQEYINKELSRRQQGYGRGERKLIENDKVEIISGVRHQRTLGSPIALLIENKDYKNCESLMSPYYLSSNEQQLLKPRPGHADLAGLIKYGVKDFRDILERASARETASRVALGAICKSFLQEFKIDIMSYTLQVGSIVADIDCVRKREFWKDVEKSPLRCPDAKASLQMKRLIDEVSKKGDTLGGKVVIVAKNIPIGLGSHTQWDLKLDGRLAKGLISIQAVKAIEFGLGVELAGVFGSSGQDEIFYNSKKGFYRTTNRAGGIEGGISNGEPIIITCTMKPIPSLKKSLNSVNLKTKKISKAQVVRSDVCAVSSLGVVCEAVVASEIANAFKEKFGADSLQDIKNNFNSYKKRIKALYK